MKTLAILLGEHPCIVNILFGPMTVHYREVLLYHVMRTDTCNKPHTLRDAVTGRNRNSITIPDILGMAG